jgi:tetratricopeptide (TPR) repeat protein
VYLSVGQYEKASEWFEKSLSSSRKIGDRGTLAMSYLNFAVTFLSLGKYNKANEYNQKALVIFTEVGDRGSMASCYII